MHGIWATLSGKRHDLKFASLCVQLDRKRLVPSQTWLRWSLWSADHELLRLRKSRRCAERSFSPSGFVPACRLRFGDRQHHRRDTVEEQSPALLIADAERAEAPRPVAMGNATVATSMWTPAAEPETAMAAAS